MAATGPLPDGWVGDAARLVVTMPGNVLVDQEVDVTNGLVVWDLIGEELNFIATNFDTGSGLYDTLTITLFADGLIDGSPVSAVAAMVTHGALVPEIPLNADRKS